MIYNDDDADLSQSSGRFDRADGGKQEHRERKAAAKGKLLRFQKDLLRKQIAMNKGGSTVSKDDHEKEDNQDAKQDQAQGTSTRKDEEYAEIQTAQDDPSADHLIQRGKKDAQNKKQAQQEYQKEPKT